jgi:hypothetical protein
MNGYRHVDYDGLHPDVRRALVELDSAIRRNTTWSAAQITYDFEQFETPPTIDVQIE